MPEMCGETFSPRDVRMPDLSVEKIFPGGVRVKALFAPEMKWRLVEEFGPHCIEEQEDGRLLFQKDETDFENILSWLMTFGSKVEVLEPVRAREELLKNARNMTEMYGE